MWASNFISLTLSYECSTVGWNEAVWHDWKTVLVSPPNIKAYFIDFIFLDRIDNTF